MQLALLPGEYAIYKLRSWPLEVPETGFYSLTRTDEEISLVALFNPEIPCDSVEKDWRCFRVVGTLDFSLKAILLSILKPLCEVSVFVVSTFDTDYILVRGTAADEAVRALRDAGFEVSL